MKRLRVHECLADTRIELPCNLNVMLVRLFSSFFSTKGGQGTGLGLLVTQKLIREHGGEITFASQEGEGSTFTVRLPYKSVID